MRKPPQRHYEPPSGPLGQGQVRYEVTYRGDTKAGVTQKVTIQRAQDFLANCAAQITEKPGTHGLGYEFAAVGGAKNLNHVRASFKTWGFTHNRWSSSHADLYIVAIHLLRARNPAQYMRECEHHSDDPTHVCEAFRVVEEYQRLAPKPRISLRAQPSEATDTAPPLVDEVQEADPQANLSQLDRDAERAAADLAAEPSLLEPNSDGVREPPPPQPTPKEPDRKDPDRPAVRYDSPGARLYYNDPIELMRAISGARPLGTPSVMHVRRSPEGAVECILLTDVPATEQTRMFNLYMQAPNTNQSTALATSAVHLTLKDIADTIQTRPRGLPFTSHDLLKVLGPWNGNPPPRNDPQLKAWTVRCDDALRGEPLHKELRRRGIYLRPSTDRTGQRTNQFGEPYWAATDEELPK